LFSGFYLPLLVILLALIVRGVAFEYRGTRDDARWRRRWDAAIFTGSLLPAILWGVAFGNIVRGVKLDAHHEYAGNVLDLLNPYALLAGATTLALFLTHGAVFLALKTSGGIRDLGRTVAGGAGLASVVLAVVFLGWTLIRTGDTAAWITGAVAAVALLGGLAASRIGRDAGEERSRGARRSGRWSGDGWAFLGTAVAIGFAVVTLFVALFPDVMPSTIDAAYSLTTTNAASTPYTLRIMSWVAVIFTPLVLIYQGWTYWVFRRRLTTPRSA
jgi:cytochrome d ubiquinol oxidase subunit II